MNYYPLLNILKIPKDYPLPLILKFFEQASERFSLAMEHNLANLIPF